MIFVKDKIYAKVWKISKRDEKYLDIQVTTSEKDKDGNYVNSGWFPRLVGHAFNSLKDTLKEGDRITITKAKLSNERYTDRDGNTKSSFRFIVLEAEIDSSAPGEVKQDTQEKASTAETPADNKDTSPW